MEGRKFVRPQNCTLIFTVIKILRNRNGVFTLVILSLDTHWTTDITWNEIWLELKTWEFVVLKLLFLGPLLGELLRDVLILGCFKESIYSGKFLTRIHLWLLLQRLVFLDIFVGTTFQLFTQWLLNIVVIQIRLLRPHVSKISVSGRWYHQLGFLMFGTLKCAIIFVSSLIGSTFYIVLLILLSYINTNNLERSLGGRFLSSRLNLWKNIVKLDLIVISVVLCNLILPAVSHK